MFSYLIDIEESSEHHRINSRQFLMANWPIGLQDLVLKSSACCCVQSGCVPTAQASTTGPTDILSGLYVRPGH